MNRNHLFLLAALSLIPVGCAKQSSVRWPATAQKWHERSTLAYRRGDLEEARHASEQALRVLPNESEVRILGANIALAALEFERALSLLEGLAGTQAAATRGRAHWYLGHVELAADELELAVADPDFHDPWAKQVASLARLGRGRRPFEVSGGLLAMVPMPRVGTTAMVIPLELNGEPTLALIATDMAEAVVDSRDGGEGSWVSVRFAGKLEVSDVPAIGRDLSGLSRQLGAPVKMLIGVNFLRHLHATVDFSGGQFVARNFEPPTPPEGTTVRPVFYRGGAMVLPGSLGEDDTAPSVSLMMNTSMTYPVALDEAGWKKAGQDPTQFAAVPGQKDLRHGMLPLLRFGAFEIPSVPGVIGPSLVELEKTLDVDLDGFAGSGLFATFRLTFADGGKTLWLEDLPAEAINARMQASAPRPAATPAEPNPSAPGSAGSGSKQP